MDSYLLSSGSSSDSVNGDTANLLGSFTTMPPSAPVQAIEIQVPLIDNEEEYEFLPGHDEVDRILHQIKDSDPPRYSTRFKSSDIKMLSASRLRNLENGRDSLSKFHSSTRRMRDVSSGSVSIVGRRRTIRTQEGFVNTATLTFSSDDELAVATVRRRTRRSHVNTDDESDASFSSAPAPAPASRRSNRVIARFHDSSSDKESDMSSNEDTYMPSNKSSTRLRPRRRPGRPRLKEVERPIQRGVRSSQRITLTKSLRERQEDDISEVEDGPAEIKYSGAKEYFTELPKDDPFRLCHRTVCDTCLAHGDSETRGTLVFCQGCTYAYHQKCLGPRNQRDHLVTNLGKSDFILQCRRCLGAAHSKDSLCPHQGLCTQCNEAGTLSKPLRPRLTAKQEQAAREGNEGEDPIFDMEESMKYNINNVMFRCASCNRAWHMSHLPPLQSRTSQRALDDDSNEPQDIADGRFQEYSHRHWTCNDCAHMPGEIETIVAWRPVDLNTYTPGYTSDMMEEGAKEYLLKWKKLSYFQVSWMPGPWVWAMANTAMRRAFARKGLKPKMIAQDAVPEEYLQVDIIFDVKYSNVVSNRTYDIDMARIKEVDKMYVKYKGLMYEDAVWESIPNPKDTEPEQWEDYRVAYLDWVRGRYVHIPRSKTLQRHLATVRSKDFATQLVKQAQPSTLTGGDLMDYQKDGLNWLYYMWYKEQNAILADEMGLGKTIQVIALFATLVEDHKCWPFLVVVPNSTCPNWRREIKTWAPSLRVVTYYGSSAARRISHEYEMFPGSSDLRCHIVVTSYETMIDDRARRIFANIPWAGLVVDEGQRLKNDKNLLYESLSKIKFPFKLLLTGTPLQNNIRELFNILQFIDPSKNATMLEAQYQNFTSEHVTELHEMIRPCFLRRTKAQVLTLPPMAQIIIPVTMTIIQRKLYKSILAKNPQLIRSIFQPSCSLKQSDRHNLNNILIQLRKCLCHPFIYSKAIEERSSSTALSHRNLVEASSKLELLEMLLPKLHECGHRVLLFSQFLDNLDIMEDFLDGLGLLHRRLDGSMSSLQKQKQIDQFNAPNSPYFAFLLSTRSGGVGINLATADTVIILDPDFNPHQDIQALSRAHRIGQQKKVLVFQLMTKGTAEEKIIQIGKKKLALDHVLIECMDAEDDANIDLESILRHGTEAIFNDDTRDDIQYDDKSIEQLLDRSQMENTKVGDDASAESQFSFASVWVSKSGDLEEHGDSETSTPSNNVWEKILKERERAAEEEAKAKAESFGRGKRKRQTVDYSTQYNGNVQQLLSSPAKPGKGDSDAEFNASGGESDQVDTDPDFADEAAIEKEAALVRGSAQARPYKRAKIIDPEPFSGGTDGISEHPVPRCLACDQAHRPGYCPLKLAGVEHCGLCGIAHFGYSRTCPHLNSEAQVAIMLGSLKESTEQRAVIEEATKYIRGVRGDLVRKMKETRDARNAQIASQS
ncbi:hypothetical protein AJ80_03525 [Polytolypa hystricis UAMH7299]|uniref:Chromatin remodeling complex subunit n=1 Tax=Polytolypa hystricis (strain UAMH7299) TaxID=1447883 RepID=A0A2B7Y9M1_POLH7|nr:hypothetical protein AJ80_03525 [Polytolypa hystricis UAMH7299]